MPIHFMISGYFPHPSSQTFKLTRSSISTTPTHLAYQSLDRFVQSASPKISPWVLKLREVQRDRLLKVTSKFSFFTTGYRDRLADWDDICRDSSKGSMLGPLVYEVSLADRLYADRVATVDERRRDIDEKLQGICGSLADIKGVNPSAKI